MMSDAFQMRVFWLVVRAVSEIPKDSGYVDAWLSHRVYNLTTGLLMTGREPERLSKFLDKDGKLRCHVAYGCDQRAGVYPYCDDRKCNSRMIHKDLLNKKQTGGDE